MHVYMLSELRFDHRENVFIILLSAPDHWQAQEFFQLNIIW